MTPAEVPQNTTTPPDAPALPTRPAGLTLAEAQDRLTSFLSTQEEPKEELTEEEAIRKYTGKEDPSAEQPKAKAKAKDEEKGDAEAEVVTAPAAKEDDPEEISIPADARFTVKIDGKEEEVTLEEALAGYQRNADYTRKQQAFSKSLQEFESEKTSVQTERAKYAEAVKEIETALKQMTPAEPDWAQLERDDPVEFARQYAAHSLHKQKLADVATERMRAESVVQRDNEEQMRKVLQTERAKLLEAVPAWKDNAVANKERAEMFEFAMGHGYTPDELSGILDHRVMVLLRKAWIQDKAEKLKPTVDAIVQKKTARVKLATPGASPASKPRVAVLDRQMEALRKDKSVAAGAAAIETLLKKG
jgi:hypothetical protein